MTDFKELLYKLNKHLNILNERKAKYAANAPLELLNQIEDHEQAITLTRQVITSELTEAEWREALEPLLITVSEQTGEAIRPRIPLQRPPRAEHFTNRDQELAQLLADLQPGRVVTLCGPGGIGKSALAAEAIWILAPEDDPPDRFPDGVIFHSFSSQPQADVALENIARAFGEEPKPTPTAAAQRALAGRRMLLLIDGAENADNLPAVLQVSGGCGVLVTSRSRKDAQAERQDIEPLASDEAVKLLSAWGKGQAADEAVVKRISNLVGRLPLALRLVGRYLDQTGETAAEYLEWLEETPIEALSHGERQEENVALLLERSLAQVNETARHVLATAGFLALVPFDRSVLATALDISGAEVRRALNQLLSYGLLRREDNWYEVSHALIHTYVRRRLAVPNEVIERMAGHFVDLAEEQSKLGLEGYARLDSERAHFMSLMADCTERKEWRLVLRLIEAVDNYLDIQGHWTDRVTAIEVGIAAAQALGDRCGEGVQLGHLGSAYLNLGRVEQAIQYHEQALTLARELGDRKMEGNQLFNLGADYRNLGQAEQAIAYFDQALEIAREIGDRRGEEKRLSGLGVAYGGILGQAEQAIAYFDQALEIAREIGDRRRAGMQLSNLGIAYFYLGQAEKAITYHDQALNIARKLGDRKMEGSSLGHLGVAYHHLGQVEQAVEYYKKALAIAREIGFRRDEEWHLGRLGNAHRDLGQVEQAIEYLDQALVIAREIQDRAGEELRLLARGNVNRLLERYEEALADFDRAIELNPDCDWGYYERGLIYLIKNNPDQVQQELSRAIDLARQKYEENAQNWRNTSNFGLYSTVIGDVKTAERLFLQAIKGSAPHGLIRKATRDLDDFLNLFPDHAQAQATVELLRQSL